MAHVGVHLTLKKIDLEKNCWGLWRSPPKAKRVLDQKTGVRKCSRILLAYLLRLLINQFLCLEGLFQTMLYQLSLKLWSFQNLAILIHMHFLRGCFEKKNKMLLLHCFSNNWYNWSFLIKHSSSSYHETFYFYGKNRKLISALKE